MSQLPSVLRRFEGKLSDGVDTDQDGWLSIWTKSGFQFDTDPLCPIHYHGAATLKELVSACKEIKPCKCEECKKDLERTFDVKPAPSPAQILGSLGGKATAAKMTKKERREFWRKVASSPRKPNAQRCNCPDGKHTMRRANTLGLKCRDKTTKK